MTFTVAFLILAAGVALGYRLPGPVARIKAAWRRRRYRPALLQPYVPVERNPLPERRADS